MGRIPRLDFPGTVAHVIARGNHRQNIFLEPADWEHFLAHLGKVKALRPFRLYAYCLMSNHIHLLIEVLQASLSTIMHGLLLPYARYLNRRLGRTGHVFQDRFKSILCDRDSYLQHLTRYIHLNPVRAGLVADPSAWPYSGHLEYLGRSERGLVDTELVLSTFGDDIERSREAYLDFVRDGMSVSPAGLNPIGLAAPAAIMGTPPTKEMIEILADRRPLERLVAGSANGLDIALLRSPTKLREVTRARRAAIISAFRGGYGVREIAAFLSMTPSGVSKALRQLVE